MFQVKATLIGFMGNEDRYPCHFKHKVGDIFVWDGEKYAGRICPSVCTLLIPRMMMLHAAGPRFVMSGHYYPFWYAPISVHDESLKKYDGLGFRNVLETAVEPQYHMANLVPKNSFKWPPHPEQTVSKDHVVVCGDIRTAAAFKVEAFDLSEKGYDTPYFRRQMMILHKVLPKPGIKVDKILDEFSKEENEGIYPALSKVMVRMLAEELEIMGYLDIKDEKASVTRKGEAKLEAFKKGLSAEERKALKI